MTEPAFRPYVEYGPGRLLTDCPDLASFGSAAALVVSTGTVKPGDTVSIYQVRRPTPEEEAAERARAAERVQQRRTDAATLLAALDAIDDPATSAVMALHRPDGHECGGYMDCDGDDFSGYEAEGPVWPCRTVLALADAHGIPVPAALR